ncbi:MAG: radical SAM protein [Phocaeicola sp.]|nr:radical SAM protein [Phocaeicola sp.]
MKQSIFNSIIDLTESSILIYNSYSDYFFVVKKEIKNILSDIQAVKNSFPKLYRRFIQARIYVGNSEDELYSLKERYEKIAYNDSNFFLMINPTLDCNFKCWYCYEKHIKNSEMNNTNLLKVKKLINNILSTNINSFTLSFFGGEPFLKYKQVVLPLIKYTSEQCDLRNIHFNISFTSNGSLLTSKRILEIKNMGPLAVQITLDGNKEAHNQIRSFQNNKGSYNIIIQNIYNLISNGCHVRLRINYTQNSIDTIKDIISDFSSATDEMKKNMLIDFHRVWQDKDSMDIIPKIRDLAGEFRNNGFKVLYNSLNEIANCCYADKKNTAIINFNGDVYKCSAKDFTKENRDGFLNEEGQIIWNQPPQYRLSLKLDNKPCQRCRIAPLCGGGCTNFIINRKKEGKEYCLYNYDNDIIDKLILDRFETYCK